MSFIWAVADGIRVQHLKIKQVLKQRGFDLKQPFKLLKQPLKAYIRSHMEFGFHINGQHKLSWLGRISDCLAYKQQHLWKQTSCLR